MRDPLLTLRQQLPLREDAHALDDHSSLKRLERWLSGGTQQMPAIVCAKALSGSADVPGLLASPKPGRGGVYTGELATLHTKAKAPSLDASALARFSVGYAQVFKLSAAMLDAFAGAVGQRMEGGDVLVLEPPALGGKRRLYPRTRIAQAPGAVRAELEDYVQNWAKRRALDFRGCVFVPQAKVLQRELVMRLHSSGEELAASFAEEKEELEKRFRRELAERGEALNRFEAEKRQLGSRLQALEAERRQLLDRLDAQAAVQRESLAEKDANIRFLAGKLERPQKPPDVAVWAERRFAGRLLLHDRAKELLQKLPPSEADLPLICDALEYLATEYLDELTGRISETERDRLCSRRYGRPFLVTPTKGTSVEKFPADYHIKYYIGHKGFPIDSTLDLHLKVGKDPVNLLRVYFLYDKEKKLVVVGALPKHLQISSYK